MYDALVKLEPAGSTAIDTADVVGPWLQMAKVEQNAWVLAGTV